MPSLVCGHCDAAEAALASAIAKNAEAATIPNLLIVVVSPVDHPTRPAGLPAPGGRAMAVSHRPPLFTRL
jgi:hypothetical protein